MGTNFAKSVTRNGLAVKRDRNTGIIESNTCRLQFLLISMQTTQSLHPGGRYYPGPPYPGNTTEQVDSPSKEPSHPIDGI